jgi:nonsense-mediated mRNA decay protein 3
MGKLGVLLKVKSITVETFLMPRRFCYECGKDEWEKGLCRQCFAKTHKLMKLPARIEIEKCSKCETVKARNKRVEWNAERFFSKLIGKEVELVENAIGKDLIYTVKVTGEIAGVEIEETAKTRIHFNVRICERCGKIASDYYEGILQLRGNFTGDVLNWIDEEIGKSTDKMVFYRLKQVKGGVDVYLGSQRFLKRLAAKLSRKHKIKLVESFKQVTQIEGREIRRRIILARFDKLK